MDAIARGLEEDNFALFAEQGTGKTCALINILRGRINKRCRIMRTLIFAPVVTLNNWKDEFKIHSYINSSEIVVLKGTSKQKIKRFNEATDYGKRHKIIITNYESVINKELYEILFNYSPEIMVFDEAHYLKTHNSKRSKAICAIADKALHRYILTGTPILNKVSDLYMQYRIMDKGETFGKNFYVFQGKYMVDMNAGWKGRPNYFPKWETNPSKYEELQQKMAKSSVRVLKKDCLDLPPLIKQQIVVEMGPDQRRAYKEMERDFVTYIEAQEKGGKPKAVVAELAITKAMRLQQIVTGFVNDDKGDIIEFKKNPRLEAVKELLTQLTPEHKVILWCSFKYNYKQLGRLCEELGIKHCYITGEQTTDEKDASIKQFRTDPETRVVIANRRAGGIGINLIEASYSIVYSRNFSLNDELQSEARNYRGGSEMHDKITKIDLAAEGTMDFHVMKALNDKQDISKKVIDLVRDNK